MKKTNTLAATFGALLLGTAALPAQAIVADYDYQSMTLTMGEVLAGHTLDINLDDQLNNFGGQGMTSTFDSGDFIVQWFATDPYSENGFSFTITNNGPNTYTSGSDLHLDLTLDLLFYDETLTPYENADSGTVAFDLRDFLPGQDFNPGEAFVATFLLRDFFTPGAAYIANPAFVSGFEGVYLSGSITAVPLPAAGWLLLSGLGLLGATARRRRAQDATGAVAA